MTIQELKDNGLLLFECISGSKAYGLDTATSDTDIKGVYYLPKTQFYGLEYVAQVNNESNDEVYYEIGRFMELLAKNNPNMLELLATPQDCIRLRHPLMDKLTPALFLSKQCRDTFAGYAWSQIKKAKGYNKKAQNPVAEARKSVLDYCFILQHRGSVPLTAWLTANGMVQERCGLAAIAHTKGVYALYYNDCGTLGYSGVISGPNANDVSLSAIPQGQVMQGYLCFHIESYSAYCRAYREYWEWRAKRNETRYLSNKEHGKDYDAKNMMHTIRLLQVAEELFSEGRLNVKRHNRQQLLDIKAGKLEYNEVLAMAETLLGRIDAAYNTSSLQETVNTAAVTAQLVAIRTHLYH